MDYIGIPDKQDFLEHYGRIGMKWYQHIFGEERRGSASPRVNASMVNRASRRASSAVQARRNAKVAMKTAKKQFKLERDLKRGSRHMTSSKTTYVRAIKAIKHRSARKLQKQRFKEAKAAFKQSKVDYKSSKRQSKVASSELKKLQKIYNKQLKRRMRK